MKKLALLLALLYVVEGSTVTSASNNRFKEASHEAAQETNRELVDQIIDAIAAEIKAAVEEEKKETWEEAMEFHKAEKEHTEDTAYRRGVEDATLVEREICAKIADESTRQDSGQDIARRIRARRKNMKSASSMIINLQQMFYAGQWTKAEELINEFADSRLEAAAELCDKPVSESLVSRIPGYVLAERIRTLKSKPSGEGKGVT